LASHGLHITARRDYQGIRHGDMYVDTKVDGLDISPFIAAALANSTNVNDVYIADFNNNGAVDLADVDPFVSALLTASA
jgi:hypothetical protein